MRPRPAVLQRATLCYTVLHCRGPGVFLVRRCGASAGLGLARLASLARLAPHGGRPSLSSPRIRRWGSGGALARLLRAGRAGRGSLAGDRVRRRDGTGWGCLSIARSQDVPFTCSQQSKPASPPRLGSALGHASALPSLGRLASPPLRAASAYAQPASACLSLPQPVTSRHAASQRRSQRGSRLVAGMITGVAAMRGRYWTRPPGRQYTCKSG